MKAIDPRCEEQLRREVAADLDGSFARLVLTFQDRLFAFAYRVSGSRPDAEEIVQDSFVRAYRALQGYSAERVQQLALRSWLYQITLNLCRNRLRSRHHREIPLDREIDGEAIDPPDDEADRPDALAEQTEQRGEIAGLVAALPERYRVAVLLRFMEELSYADIAAILDLPVGTAKSNVHRGIEMLRAALSEREMARPVGVEERQ
ncbi:MAG TPA: sigma-70 family RNA polymerase sigma factor [Chloroflexota bacterium]|nr:sigma-70 family RNA polymerase sigma factor [Chloroflexota bacterium]